MFQKTLFAALLLGIGTAAIADSTPRIDRMQAHQATRIEHGVATGALTRPETRRLAEPGPRPALTERATPSGSPCVAAGSRGRAPEAPRSLAGKIPIHPEPSVGPRRLWV